MAVGAEAYEPDPQAWAHYSDEVSRLRETLRAIPVEDHGAVAGRLGEQLSGHANIRCAGPRQLKNARPGNCRHDWTPNGHQPVWLHGESSRHEVALSEILFSSAYLVLGFRNQKIALKPPIPSRRGRNLSTYRSRSRSH